MKQVSTFFLLFSSIASASPDFATKGASYLEKLYIGDCEAEQTPHGFYGAFLQPCEFAFFQRGDSEQSANVCTDPSSQLVGKPVPVHWFFNVTQHMTKDDWDDLSSDDLPSAEELMLWPDQCVGVSPRCYSIHDDAIESTLFRLFADGAKIPAGATHVQVDCRGDALALSRLTFAFADRFEKNTPTVIAWMVTVVAIAFVATIACVYGCFRVYRETSRDAPSYKFYKDVPHDYKNLPDAEATIEVSALGEKSRLV